MKDIMYLGLGTAIPTDKNIDYIQGVNHAILIFSLAADFEKANKVAAEHLSSTGWQEVIIDKMNPVDVAAIQEAQPEVQAAYELALKDGSHAMVLDRGVQKGNAP
jgi:hypothetical protein